MELIIRALQEISRAKPLPFLLAGWADTLGTISFDMLSDFHPHGAVSQKYGVYRAQDGLSERAVFVIDKQGTIAWSKVYDMPEQPDNEEIFRALEQLR